MRHAFRVITIKCLYLTSTTVKHLILGRESSLRQHSVFTFIIKPIIFGKARKKTSPLTFFSETLRVEVQIKCKINQFKPVLIFDVCDDLFSNILSNLKLIKNKSEFDLRKFQI